MSEHPNAIIVRICAKAGLKLIKGQAAKIQAEVPDLRPEAVLEAARALRAKAGSGKGGAHPCPKKRIRAALKRRVDGFLSANPHLDAPKAALVDAAIEELAVAFPEAASGPVIPEEELDRALTATALRLRERADMTAWLAGLKGAKLILRDSLTPELWRAYEGRLGELDDEVRRRSLEALAGWGAEEVPNLDRLTAALTTPLPLEGPDPVAAERRDWVRVWEEVLLRVERGCGPEGASRRSRKNRLLLLARMFPGLGGDGSEKDRVAALDALIRERETEGALRRDREAEADRARRAWEARLVRRDELETLLPATKTETLRWIGGGRIPVAMRRDFRKWGKDLQVTMHDPALVPEWRAKLETWRAEDASSTARKAGDARARAARETRVRNLVKASLPDGTDRASLISINKVKDRFAADLFAPVELPVRDGAAALSIRVPMRLPLPPKLWAPVAEGPVTGQARKDAISAVRGGLTGLMTAFRAEAAPGLAALGEELLVPLSNLPTEMVETFITGLEGSVLRSGVGGRDPSRLTGFLRQHASQTLNRVTELHRDRVLSRASGLADYPALFPQARLMRRQIHLHLGPTNSGKTHAAIERLLAAETGLYAAPLRLMAMEWADRLNGDGIPTDLVTGEEVIRVKGAQHQSVTIEMSPLRTPIEVAVIDEAQLIADEERGWAWTQAILGLPARELHLTGSPDAEPWTRYLAEMTGDELIVHRYERLVPLKPERGPVPIEEVRPGDAIIAFSRARVLQLREDISAEGHEVATVYGALSPEVRREEARRFRDGEADVLVATDAIGMGLNLPVRRVLLSEGEKFDGVERRPLTGAEIRQIVGRAGRFGLSEGEVGLAGVYTGTAPGLGARIQDQIERALRGRPKTPELTRPRVKPGGEVVRLLGELMGTDRLTTILHKTHHDILGRDEAFRSGITEEMVLLASVLDRISMPLEDRFAYVCAPVDTRDELCWDNLMSWTRRHEAGETVPYQVVPGKKVKMITTEAGLSSAESRVKGTGLYLWCAYRWPDVYSDTDRAVAGRAALNRAISAALQGGRLTKSCRDCGDPLPVRHRFAICDECHREMRGFRDWD